MCLLRVMHRSCSTRGKVHWQPVITCLGSCRSSSPSTSQTCACVGPASPVLHSELASIASLSCRSPGRPEEGDQDRLLHGEAVRDGAQHRAALLPRCGERPWNWSAPFQPGTSANDGPRKAAPEHTFLFVLYFMQLTEKCKSHS